MKEYDNWLFPSPKGKLTPQPQQGNGCPKEPDAEFPEKKLKRQPQQGNGSRSKPL